MEIVVKLWSIIITSHKFPCYTLVSRWYNSQQFQEKYIADHFTVSRANKLDITYRTQLAPDYVNDLIS